MVTSLNALRIRARLGRQSWAVPHEFGPDGWLIESFDQTERIIVTVAPYDDSGVDWIHASISHPNKMPSYTDLVMMHNAIAPDGHMYQCFVPGVDHVNIHEFALHLFGRLDGKPVLPNFAPLGTI